METYILINEKTNKKAKLTLTRYKTRYKNGDVKSWQILENNEYWKNGVFMATNKTSILVLLYLLQDWKPYNKLKHNI